MTISTISPFSSLFSTEQAPKFSTEQAPKASAVKPFSDHLTEAMTAFSQTGRQAENRALQGIAGQGDLVTVATTLEELGLQVKIVMEMQKKTLQAYKDITQTGM